MQINKPHKFLNTVFICGVALGLTACQSVKENLDFSKKAPDEFMVVTHAPLEMPPNANLRPPVPGQPRPQEYSTDALAKQTILGPEVKTIARQEGVSEGEAVLLKRTGGAEASDSIRAQVDQETATISETDLPGIDKLKKMVGKKVEAPAEVVDPVAEIERLKQNKAEGKPVTAGKTPTIKK